MQRRNGCTGGCRFLTQKTRNDELEGSIAARLQQLLIEFEASTGEILTIHKEYKASLLPTPKTCTYQDLQASSSQNVVPRHQKDFFFSESIIRIKVSEHRL
jgi:hypothetical protein